MKHGKKYKISFDEEIISKDQAEKLLSDQGLNPVKLNKQIVERKDNVSFKTKEKIRKRKQTERDSKNVEPTLKKKRTPYKSPENNTTTEFLLDIEPTEEQEIPNQSKKESIRAQKRKKHVKLLEQKKLNTELELQQKSLNYLSKWKHSGSEWKFEKLKQVWIQQNLFDINKIPDEFWEITVEYFSRTKGHSRQLALDEALKIIENEEGSFEENLDEDYQVKLKRARNIVQSLQ